MLDPARDRPLCEVYDLAMLDLDGVVYVGGEAVPGAAESLRSASERGMRRAFITNNASRPPSRVASHLTELGVAAEPDDVVTSAQAAARVLLERLGAGAPVALLGGEGLAAALDDVGLRAVGVGDEAEALVTGYGPDVRWREVMQAATRVRDGLWWVASNTDMSIPTPFGVAPGHGVLVETLHRFTGVSPVVAGKPERPLLEETLRRMAAQRPLMVGDRLDTDIDGGHAVGVDTLLVMTGVSGLAELAALAPERRPTYVGADLAALLEPHPVPDREGDGFAQGGWYCRAEARLRVTGGGAPGEWWRVVAAAAWAALDERGEPAVTDELRPPGTGSR